MNIYPQLNNLELNELIKHWFGSPPADEIECYTPEGDYVGLFYEEKARKVFCKVRIFIKIFYFKILKFI